MNCRNHPEREALETCLICGESYCTDCLLELSGRSYCKACVVSKIDQEGKSFEEISNSDGWGQERNQTHNMNSVNPGKYEKRSRFWAFIFSLIPGVGYLHLGLMNRGLQTMVVFFGSIFVASFMNFEEIMALVLPVVMFYSIFDTQQLVKKINEGVAVEDKQLFDIKNIPINQSWIGYGLIFIGVMALLNNAGPYYFPIYGLVRKILPSILIITLGIYILRRNTQNKF